MYKKESHSWIKHLDFLFADIICLHLAYVIFYLMMIKQSNPYEDGVYRGFILIITLIDLLVMIFMDSLKSVIKRGYYKELLATTKHTCFVMLLSISYLFITPENRKNRNLEVLLLFLFYFFISYFVRCVWKYVLRKKYIKSGNRLMVIITNSGLLDVVIDDIKNNVYGRYRIAGFCIVDKDMTGESIGGIKVISNINNLVDYLSKRWVDEVFVNLPEDKGCPFDVVEQLSEMGIVTHIRLFNSETLLGNRQLVEKFGNYIVLTNTINFASPGQLFIKRTMDFVAGLFGCIITGILTIFIAPVIYFKSPGPIFFSQERVGENGKKFKIYKFRSMYLDAEERKNELMKDNRIKDGLMFKIEDDPRIIGYKKKRDGTVKKGIGHFLRSTSLDEFPQFINVLKGDMSLVGTRPPTVDEWEKYEIHHRARMATKPGITGMWQVSGRSKITDFEEVVKLDTQYIKNWSVGQDIKILLKTIKVVFKKDGSM